MAYSEDELDELKLRISSAIAGRRLSKWQIGFLISINSLIDRRGRGIRLSDKQLAKLDAIAPRSTLRHLNQKSAPIRSTYAQPRRGSYRPLRRRGVRRRTMRILISFATVGFVVFSASLFEKGSISSPSSSLVSVPASSPTTIARRSALSNISLGDFTVTDGDTIRINGERKGTRLVGFNAPETREPGCAEERALGNKAKARLRQLVSKGRLTLERVQCACRQGTEGTDRCNYGRSCAILRVDDRDVGEILISEGLAAQFVCGATTCPSTPKPWCT